jgi:hypothetical protein
MNKDVVNFTHEVKVNVHETLLQIGKKLSIYLMEVGDTAPSSRCASLLFAASPLLFAAIFRLFSSSLLLLLTALLLFASILFSSLTNRLF